MSKALEDFRTYILSRLRKSDYEYQEVRDAIKNVEAELQEFETMKETRLIVVDDKVSKEDLERIFNTRKMIISQAAPLRIEPLFDEETQKKLKALNVIKDKFVIPAYIMNSENVQEYNRHLKQITFRKDYVKRKLTQEEFNLLKEVLL